MVCSLLQDERYMATSDLHTLILSQSLPFDSSLERRICTSVLTRLDDTSNDVQSIAVKCLGVLLGKVREQSVMNIAEKLMALILEGSKELRDIYTIGLKKLISSVPTKTGIPVSHSLIARLLGGITQGADTDIKMSCIDCLSDVISRFGMYIVEQHESIISTSLHQLTSTTGIIKKKAVVLLGTLAVVVSDKLLDRLVETLLHEVKASEDKDTIIKAMGTISSTSGYRLGKQLDRIVTIFLSFVDLDRAGLSESSKDDEDFEADNTDATNELRASCFTGFESFVTRCPLEIKPFIPQLVDVCSKFMAFDPNYCYDDAMSDDGSNNGSDDDYEDDDYSDEDGEGDDDSSWKVRRSSVRALIAVIDTQKNYPSTLWECGAFDILLDRFKEREENVRVDIIDAFQRLLSHSIKASIDETTASTSTSSVTESDEMNDESKYDDPAAVAAAIDARTPAIIKSCIGQLKLKTKNEAAKIQIFALLSVLCKSPSGIGEEKQFSSLFTTLKLTLAPSSTKSLKLEVLRFLLSALKSPSHSKTLLRPSLLSVLPLVCEAVKDDWYKLIAEALRVLAKFPELLVADPQDTMSDTPAPSLSTADLKSHVTLLYDAILPRLEENDIDAEIKMSAIAAMGDLVARLGDVLPSSHIESILHLLLERMSNDITRVSALKTVGKIAQSPLKIDVSCILADATEELANFLRQHARSLKFSSLETISALIQSNSSKITDPLFSLLLTESAPLISDADLQICNLAVAVSYDVLVSSSSSVVATIKTTTMPSLLRIAASPLLQGAALTTTTKFLEELVIVNDDALTFTDVLDSLLLAVESDAKQQSILNISRCIASICAVASDKQRSAVIDDLLADVNSESDVKRRVALLTLGCLGERVDLSSVKGLSKSILGSFACPDDASKSAASIALGHVAVGAMSTYLPIILKEIDSAADNSALYLVLGSLREVITTHRTNGVDLSEADVASILPLLTGLANSKEEGIRSICSECIGCFLSMAPDKILPALIKLTAENKNKQDDEPAALMLWTILTSLKHALSGKDVKVDSLFAGHLTETGFLALLDEEAFEVRHAALLMVNAAVHYAPGVLAGSMASFIMPRVLAFLGLKSVRTIDLGPFKHHIDDALPLRKVSLSIVDSALPHSGFVDVAALLPQLAKCCADVEEVVVPCHQVLTKLCTRDEALVCQNLDELLVGLEKTICKKPKENATPQDAERANSLVRSGLRLVVAVGKTQSSEGNTTWTGFVDRIKGNERLAAMLSEETEKASGGLGA
jgi:cullin-associated NEDD8-dissociated protein 1